MKIYLNSEDLGKTITYKEENGKKNYLYCKEGFEFCENAQHTEQLLKENAQLKKKVLDWKDGIMIVRYEQQLAEKDKEIKFLQTQIKELLEGSKQMLNEGKDIMLNIRHEVCEKIREKLKKCITPACGTYIVYYEAKNVEDVLDQIERGEE